MQLDPSNSGSFRSSLGVSLPPTHKRPYSQDTSSSNQPPVSSSFSHFGQPPPKHRKLGPAFVRSPTSSQMDKPYTRNAGNQPNHSSRLSGSGGPPPRGRSKQPKGKQRGSVFQPRAAVLTEPLHDVNFITTTYKSKPLKGDWEENPKSPLMNFLVNTLKDKKPTFAFSQGLLSGTILNRSVDYYNQQTRRF